MAPTKGRCFPAAFNSNFALCTPYERTLLHCLPHRLHHPNPTASQQLSSVWRECLFVFTTLIFIIHFLCFIFEGGFASQLKVAVPSPKKKKIASLQIQTRSHTRNVVCTFQALESVGQKNENIKTNFKTIKPFEFLASRCPGLGRVCDWLAFWRTAFFSFFDYGPPHPRNQLSSTRRTFTHEVGKVSTHISQVPGAFSVFIIIVFCGGIVGESQCSRENGIASHPMLGYSKRGYRRFGINRTECEKVIKGVWWDRFVGWQVVKSICRAFYSAIKIQACTLK